MTMDSPHIFPDRSPRSETPPENRALLDAMEHGHQRGFAAGIEAAAKVAEKYHEWQGSADIANPFTKEGIARTIRALSPDPGAGQAVPSGWRDAVKIACDLLAERRYGPAARSPAHNARLVLEQALAASPPVPAQEDESGGELGLLTGSAHENRTLAADLRRSTDCLALTMEQLETSEARCRQLEAENATLRAEVREWKSILDRVLRDTAKELGCEPDNEAILSTIAASRAREDALAGALTEARDTLVEVLPDQPATVHAIDAALATHKATSGKTGGE